MKSRGYHTLTVLDMLRNKKRSVRLYSIALYLSILFLTVLFFHPLFQDLLTAWWTDPQFSHGFLIPPITVYLLWRNREKIRGKAVASSGERNPFLSVLALSFLILSLSAYLAGAYMGETMIRSLSFLSILLSSILFVYGLDVLRSIFFPIAYLLFMIPLPARFLNFVSEPLKYMVAELSARTIALFNVPVYLQKEMIHLPSITLQVEEVCSGARTIMAFVAIALVYSYLYMNSRLLKVVLVCLAAGIALVLNVVRVSAIGVLAYYVSNEAGLAVHSYGWTLIDLFGFVALFLVGTSLRWTESKNDF